MVLPWRTWVAEADPEAPPDSSRNLLRSPRTTSSDTSPPLDTVASTSFPSGVPAFTSFLIRSPTAICGTPSHLAILLAYVPFPTPGGPRNTILGTVTDCDDDETMRVRAKCERRGKRVDPCWVVGQAVRALGMAAVPYPMVLAARGFLPPRPAALARVLHQLIAAIALRIFCDCCLLLSKLQVFRFL